MIPLTSLTLYSVHLFGPSTPHRRTMYAVTEHSAICCKIQAKLGQLGWLTITFRHTLLGYCAHDLSSSLLNYMATLSPLYLLSL